MKSTRRRRGALVAGLCVAGVAAGVGLAVWPGPSTVAVSGCDQIIPLSVAVDPAAAPAVELVADQYREAHPCRIVNVLPWSDELTAASLSTRTAPDLWVATGASWASVAQAAGVEPASATTVATTPIVLAMPREAADALAWSGSATAENIAAVADPAWRWSNVTAANWGDWRLGLSGAAGGRDALAGYLQNLGSGRGGQNIVRDAGQPWADAHTVNDAMAHASAVATTEQAVAADPTDLDTVALYVQPALSVQVQALMLPMEAATKPAATDFVATLASADDGVWSAAALRSIDGQSVPGAVATTPALSAGQATSADGPSAEALAQAQEAWIAPSSPPRTLLMVDYSASMAQPFAARGDSRLQVLVRALTQASDDTPSPRLVTVYSFQSSAGTALIGEITPGGTSLAGALGPMAAKTAVGGTPLYQAIVAAVDTVQDWDGDTRVVIVTDGRQDSAGTTTRADAVEALAAAGGSTTVVLVGFGANADMGDLRQIAQAAGATVVHVDAAGEAADALTAALFG